MQKRTKAAKNVYRVFSPLEASLHLMTLKKEVPQRNGGNYMQPDLTGNVIVFSVEKVPTTIRSIQIVALKFIK